MSNEKVIQLSNYQTKRLVNELKELRGEARNPVAIPSNAKVYSIDSARERSSSTKKPKKGDLVYEKII